MVGTVDCHVTWCFTNTFSASCTCQHKSCKLQVSLNILLNVRQFFNLRLKYVFVLTVLALDRANLAVQNSLGQLEQLQFEEIKGRATEFTLKANEELGLQGNLQIEPGYPNKRHRKRKRFHDENVDDESPADPEMRFVSTVLRPVLDQICASLRSRYADHGKVLEIFKMVVPSQFAKHNEHGVSADSMIPVATLCDLSANDLARELEAYAANYDSDVCKDGSNCITCTFLDVNEQVSFGMPFKSLRAAMRFLITLPCTQVSCVHAFSKLKIVKNRLRSSMRNVLLEAFMLISCEKSFLSAKRDLILRFARTSPELSRALL